jgi:DnaJ-class molecular chaperone
MARNYYVILGVESDATPEQIKAAYRQQAKKFHPDYYGQDSQPFREVQAAYAVLSDPVQRRAYDEVLAYRNRSRGAPPESSRFRPISPEPPIPAATPGEWVEPLFNQSHQTVSSPFDLLFDHYLWRHLKGRARFESDQGKDQVEIRLTPAQARRGGEVPLMLSVSKRCSTCRGQGGIGFFDCQRCAGTGELMAEYPLLLTFPAGITDGDTVKVSLRWWGILDFLTVYFRVV